MTSQNRKTRTGGTAEATAAAEVILPKTPEIDWAAINARWEAEREKARERLKAERAGLLVALRALGIEEIEGCYDGYADSGNVQGIAVTPDGVTLGELEPRVSDFVWGMAYNLHPGFEVNDGGEGTLTWNVVEDRIDLDHSDFYTAREDYCHEDI